jgi:hypothetical protein
MNTPFEHGFKNSGCELKKLAPAFFARRAIASSARGVSVIPGISGEHNTPTFNPAARNRSTVRNRKSGRGARGSRIRASFASGVVIVRCTVR